MKSLQELIEELQNDAAFAEKFGNTVKEKLGDGEATYEAVAAAVRELGYDVTPETLRELHDQQTSAMSEEELGKIAGGSGPVCFTAVWITIVATVFESIEATKGS